MSNVLIRDFFFKYVTTVYITINIKVAAVIYRILQILLCIAIVGLIVYHASWNEKERGISSIFTNVEGVDNSTEGLVFDAIDFVKPPQEKDAFFITTKLFVTKQEQSRCVDHSEKGSNLCTSNKDCIVGRKSKYGINTGKCIIDKSVCEIRGWCPVEENETNGTIIYRLSDINNFTVYVRNNIEFFGFKKYRSNFNFSVNTTCLYDPVKNPLCPIFSIKWILDSMDVDFKDVKEKGAIIGFFIKWVCYFNINSDPCTIQYSFKRLGKDLNGEYVRYKLKYADYHTYSDKRNRTRITARGLRFLVMVGSTGYKFNISVLLNSIGALLSYFGTLSIVVYYIYFYFFFNERQQNIHFRTDLDPEREPENNWLELREKLTEQKI